MSITERTWEMTSPSTEENFLATSHTYWPSIWNVASVNEQLNFIFYFTSNGHIWLWLLFGQYRSSPICYRYSTAEKVTRAIQGRFKSFQIYVELWYKYIWLNLYLLVWGFLSATILIQTALSYFGYLQFILEYRWVWERSNIPFEIILALQPI